MIGIIILNYNDWLNVMRCVDSVDYPHARIYVVDNASSVNTAILDALQRKGCIVITLARNGGYSAGNNAGVKQAIADGCDGVLICNSDVTFDKGAVAELYRAKNQLGAGLVAPMVFDGHGVPQETILAVEIDKYDKVILMLLGASLLRRFNHRLGAFSQLTGEGAAKVFGVSGCCFLVGSNALHEVFPLDEKIFLYNEEYVIAKKMANAGLNSYVIRAACVRHLGGTSTKKIGLNKFLYFIKSENYVFRTYYGAGVFFSIGLFLCRWLQFIFYWVPKYAASRCLKL